MPDTANAVARPLEFDSPGPGPVNALLHEAIRAFGGRLRALAVMGRTGMLPETQAKAGSKEDGAPRARIEPEALILTAAAEEMKRVFDRAFQGGPNRPRDSAGPGGPVGPADHAA